MKRFRVILFTAVPLAALAILFLFAAAPVGAQGFVIVPQVEGEPGENGWFVSDVSIVWTVPALATNVVGCEDVFIDYDTAGDFIECHYEYVGQLYGGSGIIRRDTTPPEAGCNIQPGATYPLTEGESLALDCSGSQDNLSTVWASFDTNEDGVYGDAPVFYAINEQLTPCFIAVLLQDEAGNVTEFISTVTVANAPPMVKIVQVDNQNTAIGGDVTVYVDVEDPGVNDTFMAFVDWGDGDSLSGWVVPSMISNLPAHTYNFPGAYTVAVTIVDDAGAASAADMAQVTVQDPQQTLDILEADVIAGGGLGLYNHGQENSLHVKVDAARASLTRQAFDAAAGQLRAFAYQGFAITEPDSSRTPCFNLALQMADAFDFWVPPPD